MEIPRDLHNQDEGTKEPWWRPAFLLFFELSGWIGFPVALALVFGAWIDERYGTSPQGYYASVAGAFLISLYGFIKVIRKSKKVMEQMNTK